MKKEAASDNEPSHTSYLIPHASIEVAAGLVFRGSKLLITQRRPQDHLGGLWEFPGGKREPGETFEQCLRRELREELGIDVEVCELVETITHSYPDKTVHLRFFRCVLSKHEPQAIGCQTVAWIGREQLGDYEFPAADARLLQQLSERVEFWD